MSERKTVAATGSKTAYWKTSSKIVPITDLNDDEIKKAFADSVEREMRNLNRSKVFTRLKSELKKEMRKRKITAPDVSHIEEKVAVEQTRALERIYEDVPLAIPNQAAQVQKLIQ